MVFGAEFGSTSRMKRGSVGSRVSGKHILGEGGGRGEGSEVARSNSAAFFNERQPAAGGDELPVCGGTEGETGGEAKGRMGLAVGLRNEKATDVLTGGI